VPAEPFQRRLAAILIADVAGYSRLMGEDEEGTLAALTAHRTELFEPCIAAHRGRVVKTTGDGVLVEFASVVDAMRCAVSFQEGMRRRNAGTTEDKRIEFRVGVNLGDVIVQHDDVYGDGVNVAARLQAEAKPGGICISHDAYRQVQGKIDLTFEDLGELTLKNIVERVRAFTWPAENLAFSNTAVPRPVFEKPSIAVLPFDNMSNDPEQSYFADGIAEDVITDLSKVSGLTVIARNSSFGYRGQSPDIRQVSRELGVRYVLEGSVRKGGQRVRINAQLIDGLSGGHVWADRFDRNLENIFEVQDDVTREIVRALQVALTPDEAARRSDRRKVDPEAYDLYLQARAALWEFSSAGLDRARELLVRAVEIDSSLAKAHAGLAMVNCVEHANNWNNTDVDLLESALQHVDLAIAADPNEPAAYHALALTQMWRRNLEEAVRAAERAIDLEPNFAGAMTALGSILDFSGEHERAADLLQQALRLDPEYHPAMQFLARSLFSLRRYEEAEATLRKRLLKVPHSDMSRIFLASVCGHLGRRDDAQQAWRELYEINPAFDVRRLLQVLPYRDPAWFDHLVAGLRAAELPV
jgi:adenylate cyclase